MCQWACLYQPTSMYIRSLKFMGNEGVTNALCMILDLTIGSGNILPLWQVWSELIKSGTKFPILQRWYSNPFVRVVLRYIHFFFVCVRLFALCHVAIYIFIYIYKLFSRYCKTDRIKSFKICQTHLVALPSPLFSNTPKVVWYVVGVCLCWQAHVLAILRSSTP